MKPLRQESFQDFFPETPPLRREIPVLRINMRDFIFLTFSTLMLVMQMIILYTVFNR